MSLTEMELQLRNREFTTLPSTTQQLKYFDEGEIHTPNVRLFLHLILSINETPSISSRKIDAAYASSNILCSAHGNTI